MADDFANVDSADLQTSKYQLLSQKAVDDWLTKGGTVKGVQILDYGQGDCNAIVDETGKPVLFFDMGGGKHTGSRSHPWHQAWDTPTWNTKTWFGKVLDLGRKPSVILSHWDGDHYSTAWYLTHRTILTTKTVPGSAGEVKDLRWLAPRQCKHPSKLEFVLDLTDLSCWPANTRTHTFKLTGGTRLVVDKCKDTSSSYDPNLDGLAVVLEREGSGQIEERMVLPGDAPFNVIPSCSDQALDKVILLLAFHHGSETHLAEAKAHIPAPLVGKGKIAYTFGLKPDGGRCYGHPSEQAILEYQIKGWTDKLLPSGGDGAFGTWPPGKTDTGNADARGDVSHDFTVADTPVSTASTPVTATLTTTAAVSTASTSTRPKRIAFRRKKTG